MQHCVRDAVTIKCAGATAKLVQHDQAVAGCMLHSKMSLLMDPLKKGQLQAAANTSCGCLLHMQRTKSGDSAAADVCSTAWSMVGVGPE